MIKVNQVTSEGSVQAVAAQNHGLVWERLCGLAAKRGIIVALEDFTPFAIGNYFDALYFTAKGTHYIAINSCLPEEKKDFVLAHELGHYALHKQKGNLVFGIDPEHRLRYEEQANRFARLLLQMISRGECFIVSCCSVLSQVDEVLNFCL